MRVVLCGVSSSTKTSSMLVFFSRNNTGGEGLAKRKGYRREAGSEGSAAQMRESMDKNRI
jgi:hypothetical protein